MHTQLKDKKHLKKYFIPNRDNDYKPHILRETSVAVIAFIAVVVFFGGVLHSVVLTKTDLLSAVIPKILADLANSDRFSSNLDALQVSSLLEEAARRKAEDMAAKSYFAHDSPDGKTPWHWFGEVGYNFSYAGENLAVNFTDSEAVNAAWMASPAHRANILNSTFTEIGIATAKGIYKGQETIFVVQMFGKPRFAGQLASLQTFQGATVTTIPAPASSAGTAAAPETKPPETAPRSVLGEAGGAPSADETVALAQNSPLGEERLPEPQGNPTERLLTNPSQIIRFLYGTLFALVVISLILMIFIEVRKQHPLHIFYGLALLALIIGLFFAYKTFIIDRVIIL
ncbi:CAP domain-containing protein [Patescibacteria group bacterium]|nr:MAG: CAP domain-containing protein [Patescibacteria group bacterium]